MLVSVPQFTAPSYGAVTANEVQRCVNLYPEKTADGYVLVSTPGLDYPFAISGAPCRGAYSTPDGSLFYVHGTSLNGSMTLVGSTGPVYFADSELQVLIIEATSGLGYIYTFATGVLTQITDVNFPAATHCTFQDGYFIVCDAGTGRYYLSALLNGLSWTPLKFATAESRGDDLVGVYSNGQYLYLVGKISTEIHYNTGASSFPFERVNGTTLPCGAYSALTIANMSGSLFFRGSTGAFGGAVWQISGTESKRISTPYIETIVRNFIDADCYAFCYQIDGHAFYQLTCTGVANPYTFVYDISEGVWHQKESNISGTYTYDRLRTVVPYLNASDGNPKGFDNRFTALWVVGSRATPVNKEGTVDIRRERIFGPIESGTKKVFHREIRFTTDIDCDFAIITSVDCVLDWTDDNGRTYSTARTLTKAITASTIGQRVVFTASRLGSSASRYYRLRFIGPAAKLILKGCDLDLEQGRF